MAKIMAQYPKTESMGSILLGLLELQARSTVEGRQCHSGAGRSGFEALRRHFSCRQSLKIDPRILALFYMGDVLLGGWGCLV